VKVFKVPYFEQDQGDKLKKDHYKSA